MTPEQIKISETYGKTNPKSYCTCRHLGDGGNSQHGGIIGHGPCMVENCGCQKFTWASFTLEFQRAMARAGKTM